MEILSLQCLNIIYKIFNYKKTYLLYKVNCELYIFILTWYILLFLNFNFQSIREKIIILEPNK